MKPPIRLLLLASVLALTAGCSAKRPLPTAPIVAESIPDQSESSLAHARRHGAASLTGTSHGALYALYRPEGWNGDLVLYMHGYSAPGLPLALPTADFAEPLRDSLLSRGFAVAYSSYSENGYAVESGVRRTAELEDIFSRRLGRPQRVFLTGHSLGGLVAITLAETHPDRYAGALVMSGILGGSPGEVDYVSNVRVLFDHFYPGVLPGDLLHLPAGLDLQHNVIDPAVAAMQADPQGAFLMSQIAQTPIPFSSPEELVQSIVRALSFQALELQDLLGRTRGESFFDNSRTVYTGAAPQPVLDDLNARVARYKAGPAAKVFLRRWYETTGRLQIPVLALHTTLDPVVPVFNETVYAARVAAARRSRFLEQRLETRYGHTGFPPEQMIVAFDDLVAWANRLDRHHRDRDRHHDRDNDRDRALALALMAGGR